MRKSGSDPLGNGAWTTVAHKNFQDYLDQDPQQLKTAPIKFRLTVPTEDFCKAVDIFSEFAYENQIVAFKFFHGASPERSIVVYGPDTEYPDPRGPLTSEAWKDFFRELEYRYTQAGMFEIAEAFGMFGKQEKPTFHPDAKKVQHRQVNVKGTQITMFVVREGQEHWGYFENPTKGINSWHSLKL